MNKKKYIVIIIGIILWLSGLFLFVKGKGFQTRYRHTDALCWDLNEHHNTYRNLAEKILEDSGTILKTEMTRILEVGAGSGSLAWHLRDLMQSRPLVVVTLDGNKETKNSPYIDKNLHFICRTDKPYLLMENNEVVKFDIVLSYEHFEHIADEHFDMFLDNIKKHIHKDTVIYVTATTWWEENIHINVKTKEQW
jgi:cyclopropane fatty-acyl-phospholipid synthase-like methyltransferase